MITDEAVQMPASPITPLPSGSENFHLSMNNMLNSQDDHVIFRAIDRVSPTGLTMGAEFPWTLEYSHFFPEGDLVLDHHRNEPNPLLGYSPYPFTPGAGIPQHGALDTPIPHTPTDMQPPNMGREPCMPGQQQTPRLSGSSTPVYNPAMQATDDDITVAENFCHVRTQLADAYQAILAFYAQQTDPRFKNTPFPSFSVFNSFIQLYFEYFDTQLPFIHRSLLEKKDTPWMLALAVASIGCQYTRLSKRCHYSSILPDLLRLAIPNDFLRSRGYDTMTLAQCSLLVVVGLMFIGFKDSLVNLQVQRAWLASLIRRFVISSNDKDTLLSTEMNSVESHGQWQSWIRRESERRLAYCFSVVDCYYFIFLGAETCFSAKEFEQILPSSDNLWVPRDENEWRSRSGLNNVQQNSLNQLLSMDWTSNDALQHSSELCKLVLHLTLFVEERRAINASQSCVLFDLGPEDGGPVPNARLSTSYRKLDWKYEILTPATYSPSESVGISESRKIFFHLLGILRHVPLKQLYAYSGWYASKQDMLAAEAYLSYWMSENPIPSRQCVAHAGALIGEIRSTPINACYHSFSLLIATLYLWVYAQLQPERSETSGESIPLHPPASLLKIDQHHEPGVRERWIETGSGIFVHLTGVGMLSTPGSSHRLLKEFLRVLSARTGWPTLQKGLTMCMSELLNDFTSPMKALKHRS
ncbi:hypothetical protein N7466_002682 [Penicillium verhagenii]|uniref:uncharacterized protein n=1 Tax=Penicillium verhagenii TaxID=1562060 RepID=UPI0025453E2A|nr:uncharacterized protein N7466_002682 [Penicillium verhagenii]KAJ5939548.1 hypothetical protein N7466_002682 [Penicillium verhagenii]